MTVVLSPFQQHREKIAQINQETAILVDSKESLHIVNAELERDIKYLRTFGNNMAERNEYKLNVVLPKWLPKAERYLQEERIYPNPIFVWCIIWLFDTQQFDQGLDWAEIAIEQNQDTPTAWSMKLPGFVARAVFEWVETTAANGHSIEPYFSRVFELVKNKWRLYESDKAEWYKFAGLYLLRDENGTPKATAIDNVDTLKQAQELLTQAHEIYSKVGVKTMLGNIEQRINALTK
ncbi:phage terminase small subunit [Gilliamella sp. wkB308]|uniref:phage terminase small subunit n=1 Tax=Gilliamella sp. wkB308 TaxID=3120263 RepID=UPI00080ED4AE|nr:phage terminase small subunit [Gilliamella apicola]OCF98845.1 hypothetical protein A9G10_06360 [Gilliamella apicola]